MADDNTIGVNFDALGAIIPAVNPALFPVMPADDDERLAALCDQDGFLPSSQQIGNTINYSYSTVTNISESIMSQVLSQVSEITNELHSLYVDIHNSINEELHTIQQSIEALVYDIGLQTATELSILSEEVSTLQTEVYNLTTGVPVTPVAVSPSITVYGSSASAVAGGGESSATATGGTANVEVDQYGAPINYPGYPQPPGTTPTPTPLVPPMAPPGPVPPKFPAFPTTQPPFPVPQPPPPRYPTPVPPSPYIPGAELNPDVPADNCGNEPPHHAPGLALNWDDVPEATEQPSALPNVHPSTMPYSTLEIAAADYYAKTWRPIINALPDPPGAPCNWRVLDFVTMLKRSQRGLMGVTE